MLAEVSRLARRSSCNPYRNSLAALLATLLSVGACLAEPKVGPPARGTVPTTFEALPNNRLPPGTFAGWCGLGDRYLLVVQGWIDVFEGKTKVSAPSSFSTRHFPKCRQDGRELVFYDHDARQVKKVEIETGKRVVLATFRVETASPVIAFSPDLQRVATNTPLQLTADAGNLKVIPVDETPEARISNIIWSPDGARVMIIHSGSIDVLDANGGHIGGGRLPKERYAREGWFDADDQAVFLFLIRNDDESGPGSVVKCSVANWKCSNIKSRVDFASVGGRGWLATVGPLDKPYVAYDDSTPLYSRYAVELRGGSSALLARQVFSASFEGRHYFEMWIAPSGRRAVLTWTVRESPSCPKQEEGDTCKQGLMIDLSSVNDQR